MIHPSAEIDPEAEVGDGVSIGAFAVVEKGAVIGRGCSVAAHAVIRGHARIGESCRIDSFAVVGGDPNHLEFNPETQSTVEIGAGSVLREGVTVHRSMAADGSTRLGIKCFLMAGSHVGHDSVIGDRVVIANDAMTGGHVSVASDCFLGGNSGIHQFTRVGRGSMIGGGARITTDIAPFCRASERNQIGGLNLVGLRRRNVPTEVIRDLKRLYQIVLRSPGNPVETAAAQSLPESDEGRQFLEFFIPSKRGYAKSVVSRS